MKRQPPDVGARLMLRVAAVFAAFLFLMRLVGWTVDWMWLEEMGYGQIFWRILGTEAVLFAVAFIPLTIYFWFNRRMLFKTIADWQKAGQTSLGELLEQASKTRRFRIVLPAALAFLFAFLFATGWDNAIRFGFGGAFGLDEPVFGRDVGFYVFRLPLIDSILSLVLLAGLLMTLAHLAVLYGTGLFPAWKDLKAETQHRALGLLGGNALVVVVAGAADYYIELYRLLYASGGTVVGPGYTDVNFIMPALLVMTAVALVLAAVVVYAMMKNRPKFLVSGFAAAAVIHVIALWIAPGIFQALIVNPSELERERAYLERNIAFTRKAFDIDTIEERAYPGTSELTFDKIENNQDTIRNIRLWDYRPLLRTFRQIQQIRLYYQFNDVDVDRYQLSDGYRQVMVSARELTDTLPPRADTWVNRHLQYTHGYGLAMSLAAQEGGEGSPTLIVKDLPPRAERGLQVDRPAIYFGERMSGHRIVSTGIRELDYPKGDDNVYVNYDGTGGIPVSGFFRRLLFALYFYDINILLTEYVDDDSRIQIRRPIRERISEIAPFLELDRDPYLVLDKGRVYWIQDAYTTTNRYPYSEEYNAPRDRLGRTASGLGESLNYVRNSVKIIVDAYSGAVDFYVIDEKDPIIKAYRDAFPVLLKPLSAMPESLKAHLRFPQDLFEAQVTRYANYHMQDPQVFYNNEDLWEVPREKYAGSPITMEPYYMLMRLPGEDKLKFILMMPMTPQDRDNMIAWMAAHSDFPDYGKRVVFKLPKERLIFGPMQVEALIDQDTDISRQLSLWDQRGSRVIRGNLLAVPVDHSLLYVEPVYLVAENNDVPQLKRMIAVHGDQVTMAPTLDGALRALFGKSPPAEAARPGEARPLPDFLKRVRERIEDAQKALSDGDWPGFGRAMESLKDALMGTEEKEENGDAEQ